MLISYQENAKEIYHGVNKSSGGAAIMEPVSMGIMAVYGMLVLVCVGLGIADGAKANK